MVIQGLVVIAFAGPPLQVPWQCGVTKPCTQGHNGFSHTGTSEFAWDFDVNEGEEVWAASAGVVSHIRMDSTNGGCDEAYAADANYVVVAHDDDTSISYVHLQPFSSPLEVGDAVVPGTLIGRVGLTGYVCGDHLHLAVMEQCGSSYCASLPATFVDYGDPASGDQIESTNCPACTLELDGTQTLVSELDAGCFVRETTAWWSSFEGDDDHHFYTMATDAAEHASTGTWRFGVAVPGDYRVEVFVPMEDAAATGAVYAVHHAAGVAMVPVDQAAQKGWQELGTFAFTGTEGEGIVLGDATGESQDLEVRLAYDAVRLTFVPGAGESTGGDGSDESSGGNGGDVTGASAGEDGPASTTTPGGTDDGTGTGDDALPTTFGEADDEGGCGCTSGDDRAAWWLAPIVLALRRRRR